jgi:hypothetical protein
MGGVDDAFAFRRVSIFPPVRPCEMRASRIFPFVLVKFVPILDPVVSGERNREKVRPACDETNRAPMAIDLGGKKQPRRLGPWMHLASTTLIRGEVLQFFVAKANIWR